MSLLKKRALDSIEKQQCCSSVTGGAVFQSNREFRGNAAVAFVSLIIQISVPSPPVCSYVSASKHVGTSAVSFRNVSGISVCAIAASPSTGKHTIVRAGSSISLKARPFSPNLNLSALSWIHGKLLYEEDGISYRDDFNAKAGGVHKKARELASEDQAHSMQVLTGTLAAHGSSIALLRPFLSISCIV